MEVLDYIPEGWGIIQGALTHRMDHRWINNKKSRWKGDYKHALIPLEIANEHMPTVIEAEGADKYKEEI